MEINQRHFEHIISMSGLWTERLYLLFDSHNTSNLSFCEFLEGIGFLKSKIYEGGFGKKNRESF